MKTYLKFLKSVLLHKWFVFVAGRRLKVSLWRRLLHDLSKLTPTEFGPYARNFYGTPRNKAEFEKAWHFHKLRNPHHWEFWVSVDYIEREMHMIYHFPILTTLPIPLPVVREMIADWFAAARAYNGKWPDLSNYEWLKKNKGRMQLHPDTEMRIGLVLAEATSFQW